MLSHIHRINRQPRLRSISQGSLAKRRHCQKQHVKIGRGRASERKMERGKHFQNSDTRKGNALVTEDQE